MSELCYITTCKGRLAHLQQSLPRVVGQPVVSCVVVDYSCPNGAAAWVRDRFPQVRVVEVPGQDLFNLSRARNLGASVADTDWLGFFDADILWAPNFSSSVLPALQRGAFLRAEPVTLQTWGSLICHRDDFIACGGYDEAFCGWGGEDDDLRIRLTLAGLKMSGFSASLLGEIPHDDGLRVRYYDVKEKALQFRINMVYMQAKHDLMRLLGAALSLEVRQSMVAEVTRAVTVAARDRLAEARLEVELPAQLLKPPAVNGVVEHWALRRRMVYSVDMKARFSERLAP